MQQKAKYSKHVHRKSISQQKVLSLNTTGLKQEAQDKSCVLVTFYRINLYPYIYPKDKLLIISDWNFSQWKPHGGKIHIQINIWLYIFIQYPYALTCSLSMLQAAAKTELALKEQAQKEN